MRHKDGAHERRGVKNSSEAGTDLRSVPDGQAEGDGFVQQGRVHKRAGDAPNEHP